MIIRVCVPLKDNMESSERKYSKQDSIMKHFLAWGWYFVGFKALVFLTIFVEKVTALLEGSTYVQFGLVIILVYSSTFETVSQGLVCDHQAVLFRYQ